MIRTVDLSLHCLWRKSCDHKKKNKITLLSYPLFLARATPLNVIQELRLSFDHRTVLILRYTGRSGTGCAAVPVTLLEDQRCKGDGGRSQRFF